MFSPTFRIWGYESNWGSFAQFTKVQAHQCVPEAEAPDLGGGRGLHARRRDRVSHAPRLGAAHALRAGDVVLVWGGAGGLGSMAIQIARAAGAIPVAVVSCDDKIEYCKKLGARGCDQPQDFDHWGMLPHWKDDAAYAQVAQGRARVRRRVLGSARRAQEPADRVRASGRGHACRPRSSSATPAAWS